MDLSEEPSSTTIEIRKPPPIERFDYVIVVDRDIKKSPHYTAVEKFLNYLQNHGIHIELRFGNIKQNIYVMLHITDESVQNFASVYEVDIEDFGHHYIPISSINLKVAQTPLTLNNDIFERNNAIATNTERILIIYGMLCEARFGDNNRDNKYGVNKLINMGAIKDVYPLHDGPYAIQEKTDEELNDRQFLLKYWANFSVWYKEQPLNLIEKYYGSEVAFYFAWLGFYNQMLIPASVVGLICFIIGIFSLIVQHHETLEEICNSDLKMCPRCSFGHSCISTPLKVECESAKAFVIFDNYATVFFAIFMSFWATMFINQWKRFENVLKIRWNVTASSVEAKTTTRLPYKEKATHKRISSVTGLVEAYTPKRIQLTCCVLSFGACLLLVGVVLLAVFGVIVYRIIMAALIVMSNLSFIKTHAVFIESCSSSMLQVLFIKMYGKFYAPMSEWLTNMENPRTQLEFDDSVVHKRYILGFANNYAALFYMAFFKGRFYSPSHTGLISMKSDRCHTNGCLLAVCVQLFVLMLLKSMAGNILTLVLPKITRFIKIANKEDVNEGAPQWEEEFELYPAGRYLLTTEFLEMIVQYGFVTFFVAAFPLAPLCALINNCMELRLDAYKLVTRYRRPVPKRQSGIGPWKHILETITHLSVVTNAFVLSFTTDFVPREIYKYQHNNLKGYVEASLSIYDMKDTKSLGDEDINDLILETNTTLCHYRDLRHPPDHPHKYTLTNQFWFEIGFRLLCVIIFEHVIMVANGVLAYFIPEVPQRIERSLYHEKTKHREEVLDAMHEEARKLRQVKKRPKLKIRKSKKK